VLSTVAAAKHRLQQRTRGGVATRSISKKRRKYEYSAILWPVRLMAIATIRVYWFVR